MYDLHVNLGLNIYTEKRKNVAVIQIFLFGNIFPNQKLLRIDRWNGIVKIKPQRNGYHFLALIWRVFASTSMHYMPASLMNKAMDVSVKILLAFSAKL